MLVLVVYDIQTVSECGKSRLRKVSKACESVGRRIQNSVFECVLDASQLRDFQNRLRVLLDPKVDSVRYYNLGNTYRQKIMDNRPEALCFHEDPLIL